MSSQGQSDGLSLDRVQVRRAFDRAAASAYLRERAAGIYLGGAGPGGDTVLIRLAVGDGPAEGRAWGCDLSDQYVRINADYTT